MSGGVHVLSGAGEFDERRNTSRNFEPEHGAAAAAIASCRAGRGQDWYEWVVAWGAQEHRHDLRQKDGKPAACPVRGCKAVA